MGSHFAIAIYQYQLYEQIRTLNTSLEQRVKERTVELQKTNQKLVQKISDRLKTRADLERVSYQNELILNSAGEGIYGLDLDEITTFVNPAAAYILGYSVDELQNQPMHEMVKHSTAEGTVYDWQENPIHQTILTGEIYYVTNEIFWRKDKSIPVKYICTPIREKKQIVGAVVIFKDITERQIIDRIIQTLTNLISNAIKFSPPNTVITLSAELQANKMVKFQVQDCGRGIPLEHLETIFDRFQQVDASDSRNRGL